MTMASMPMASIVSTVSRSDSPLTVAEVDAVNVIVSAERRLAAVSKERRVRVDGSMKTVATVRPLKCRHLRDGPLGHLGKSVGEVHDLEDPFPPEIVDGQQVPRGRGSAHLEELVEGHRAPLSSSGATRSPMETPSSLTSTLSSRRVGQVLANEVGPDGKLPVTAVDHDGELHLGSPSPGGKRLERSAHGPAGE